MHLSSDNQVKEARILEFVGERNYVATYQDSLALWYIEGKSWQGFVLNLDITHQFLQSNNFLRTESIRCDEGGVLMAVSYTPTNENGVCIKNMTYYYGFNDEGDMITCTEGQQSICPIQNVANPSTGGGQGNTGGNPSSNPIGFPSSGGVFVGANPWGGWGLGSNYGGGIGGVPIYLHDPAGQYPIDPGNNLDPRDGWLPFEPPMHPALAKIYNSASILNKSQKAKLNKSFTEMYNTSLLFKTMADDLGNGEPIIFLVEAYSQTNLGSYNHQANTIIFNGEENITNRVLSEELFHAEQHRVDPNIADLIGTANQEFEPKLFQDLINQNNEPLFKFNLAINEGSNKSYEDWINDLTNKGTVLPNSISQDDYLFFVNLFKSRYAGTSYADLPVNNSITPYTLLYLINSCNCNH